MKHSDPLWPVVLLIGAVLSSGIALEVYARSPEIGVTHIAVVGETSESIAGPDGTDELEDDDPDATLAVSEDHEEARAAARRGELARALELFAKVVAEQPQALGPRLDLGYWLRRAGKTEASLQALERARAMAPDSVDTLFQLATTRRVAGDLAGAERDYRAVLEMAPSHTSSIVALGRLLRKRGALADALSLLEHASRMGDNRQRARTLIALGRTRADAKDSNRAAEAFRAAVDYAPSDPSVRVAVAKNCLASGERKLYALAREQMERAALLAPDRALVIGLLGWVRERCGDRDGARSAYQRALQIDPNQDYAERKLVRLDLAAQSLDAARRHAEHLVVQRPDNPEHHFLIALVSSREGKLDEARVHYGTAIERAPDHYPEAYFNLGKLEKTAGNLEAAAQNYRKALELEPDYIEALNNLALVLGARGRGDEAEATLARALELDPRYAPAWVNLAERRAAERRFDEAKLAFGKALEARPRLASALLGLARAHRDSGALADAIVAYKSLLEVQPKQARPWFELAELLEQRGDLRGAAEAAGKAAALDPEQEAFLFKRADMLAKTSSLTEARATFEELIDRFPSHGAARLALAELLLRVGDAAGCEREARRALDSDPTLARPLLARCSSNNPL